MPKSANPNGPVTLTISADNVDETQENAVKHVEYTVVIVPVARLEIVSEKTTIKVGVFQKLYTFVQIEVFSWKTSTSWKNYVKGSFLNYNQSIKFLRGTYALQYFAQ